MQQSKHTKEESTFKTICGVIFALVLYGIYIYYNGKQHNDATYEKCLKEVSIQNKFEKSAWCECFTQAAVSFRPKIDHVRGYILDLMDRYKDYKTGIGSEERASVSMLFARKMSSCLSQKGLPVTDDFLR